MVEDVKERFVNMILLGVVGFAGSLFLLAVIMILLSALGIVVF